VIEARGRRYFLKAVKPGQDRELRFYSALLGGLVRREDARYLIPAPLLITQTEQSPNDGQGT
jgi:thymidylate synthase ThyX